MKLSMFTDPAARRNSYPKLKGRAAEVKRPGPALLHVWERWGSAGDRIHQQVREGLRHSIRLDQMIEEHTGQVTFPEQVAKDFLASTCAFLGFATVLANHYMSSGHKLFNITIKFHYLYHAALQAQHLHPQLGWNYQGEDLMDKVRILASSCVRGNPAERATYKLMRKYALGIHMQLPGSCPWRRR